MDDPDTKFMKRAIELAAQGAGLASPNPMVGAVVVNGGEIVGEGFHRYDQLRHAESYALELAGDLARGATLYCNLEPCSHHGRTPPCSDSVIEAGIKRAVIATVDPDARVCGRGIDQMRAAGISVEVGLGADEAFSLNEAYFKRMTAGRPFLHAIIVEQDDASLDGVKWKPSPEFLSNLRQADMIALGTSQALNDAVIGAAINPESARKVTLAGTALEIENARRRYSINGSPTLALSPETGEISYRSDSGSFEVDTEGPLPESAQIFARFAPVADRLGILCILAMPGAFGASDSQMASQADKITIITRSGGGATSLQGGVGLNLVKAERRASNGFDEVTGYPSRQTE